MSGRRDQVRPPARRSMTIRSTIALSHRFAVSALSPRVASAMDAGRHAVERSKAFLSTYSGKSSADNPALQVRLGRTELMADAASKLIDLLAKDIMSDAENTPIPIAFRARQRATASYIAGLARDSVTLLAQGAGASGDMADSPIQRAFRDINMSSRHVVFDYDPTMELHGKMVPDPPPFDHSLLTEAVSLYDLF